MKILFLSELLYPHYGGAELATYLYAKLLSGAKHEVVVVTNRFAGEPEFSRNGNLKIYRLPLFKHNAGVSVKYSILKRFDVLFSSFMRKMMKWAELIYIPRFWYSTIPLAKAYGKPVITHLHDYVSKCPLSNAYNLAKDAVCGYNKFLCQPSCIYFYEKTQGRGLNEALTSMALNSTVGRFLGKIVELSDAVICVSKMQRDMITKFEPSLRDKACVIHNPLPESTHIEMEGDDLGYFGGNDYLKGFQPLFRAMMRISHNDRTVARVQATKFPSSIEFTESLSRIGILSYGKLDKIEYEKLYRKIRGVIVPSIWHEPWPYVVVEAIVQGRFVIASRVGGIPEQVEGCKGALLCEPGNYKELAEAIEFVASLEKEKVIDLGFQNKETFLKRFNNETTSRKLIGVFEKLA